MNIIELKDITKTYYMGALDVPVLHGISLNIQQGEFIAIMGPSGSGKSTLLHILGLLDKPSGGSFVLANQETANLSDSQLATIRNGFLGFIFQSFNLLPRMSALENVLMPLVYSDDRKAKTGGGKKALELLEKVGLKDRIAHKPNELSGGQQQRVAIARSLINNPSIIMADEPTGNLDSKSAFEIIEILKKLNDSGITIVMVTHEPDLAQAAKRIIRLQDGLVIADETVTKHVVPKHPEKTSGINGSVVHKIFNFRRVRDYFVQAIRALFSNKTRSLLSILGVLIGVTGLIAMLALGQGAQEATRKQMANLGSNILMISPGSPSMGGISMESGSRIRFTLEDADAVKRNVNGISYVSPYSSGRGQVVFGSKNRNTRIEGTSPDYQYMKNAKPARGRFFTANETISRAKVAVVGQTIVDEIFGEKDPLGEFIKINRIDFQVIGVLPVKGSSGWRNEDDKINIPVNTAMYRVFGKPYIDSMDVQVSDANLMDQASYDITQLLLRLHRLSPARTESINIHNMADIQATVAATMKTFSFLLGGIAFISLLVGGIGIMNIMLVSVTERTKEIGLRKAVGANNNDIMFQFVIESVAICVLGGIIGILLGSGISVLLAVFAGWKTVVTMPSVLLAFTFSALIGLVFGTWPAKKASQLNPIEALRYE
ncbi:MAG: ABC transporter permease [Elusimicrobiota bacterium]